VSAVGGHRPPLQIKDLVYEVYGIAEEERKVVEGA
jgi:hypothetical protein